MDQNTNALEAFLACCQQRAEQALDDRLPAPSGALDRLHQAMRYSALGGGKRVRATLVYAAAQAAGATLEQDAVAASQAELIDDGAAAVEMIHAYSLIHDDLPAMDDDDLRRGRPSCHKAFDEATAILAGDALLTQAFEVLAGRQHSHLGHGISTITEDHQPEALAVREQQSDSDVQSTRRLQMIQALARGSGSRGMVGGQALDLASEGQPLDLALLENIHIHKTGALIRASVALGALAQSGLSDEAQKQLDHYAKCIGLAFQIQDDLLDVEGDTQTLGKQSGADAAHQKSTYPALLGVRATREAARSLVDEALKSLQSFDERADPLRWIADYIVNRNR